MKYKNNYHLMRHLSQNEWTLLYGRLWIQNENIIVYIYGPIIYNTSGKLSLLVRLRNAFENFRSRFERIKEYSRITCVLSGIKWQNY